jgi:hypothetical protein
MDEKDKKNQTAPLALRERLAKAVGLDPTSATNDEMVVAAHEEAVADIEKAKEETAAAAGLSLSDARAKGIDKSVEDQVDFEEAGEKILARAEEIRRSRMTSRAPEHGRKVMEDIADAGQVAAETVETIGKAGGLLRYVRNQRPLSMKALMAYETDDPKIRMLQRANDDLLLIAHANGMGTEESRIKSVRDVDGWEQYREAFAKHSKAMDTTEGSAWAPTRYSYDLQENVYQSTAVARLFPRGPWVGPGSTMSVPVEGTDITIYGAAEPTSDDDDAKYTASTPGLGTTVTVTAKSLAARSVWSLETEEDFIIDYVDHIRMKFVREFARGFDEALLDGDTSATHQDTGWAPGTGDRRKQFSGLRYKGLNDATTLTSCASYFNYEQVMTPTLLMGAYAVDLEGNPTVGPASGGARITDTVLICSHALKTRMTALRDTRNNNIFLTPRFAGDVDARQRGYGVVTMLGGYQVVPSAKVRSDYNASGIYDGSTTTYTAALWVYCPAWHIYDKRQFGMTVVDRPEHGQRVLVGTMRLAFQHMYASTAHTTSMLYYMVDTSFGTG